MSNLIIAAAAGSGKTSYIVERTIEAAKSRNILILTFTHANEEEIRKKLIERNKFIPVNVAIKTWFSFLFEECLKPYQDYAFEKEIKYFEPVSGISANKISEKDYRHYLNENNYIYSDKLAKAVIKCNEKSNGALVKRLNEIYSDIYIDEFQDLSAYDLEFLKLLFSSPINILLVGDPRQSTFSTSNSPKNKKYKYSKILDYFRQFPNVEIDDEKLQTNYRSCSSICNFSNTLYPDFKACTSGITSTIVHQGIYFVPKNKIREYLSCYDPMQLRWSARQKIETSHKVLNFGISKGLEFDRVLIYPTEGFIHWLKDKNFECPFGSSA